jgi:nitrogen fixation/metabolism regulation signal transduction histidine kinase
LQKNNVQNSPAPEKQTQPIKNRWRELSNLLRSVRNFLHPEQILSQTKHIERRLSIKAKISISIISAFILIVPMVSLSMHYLSQMWHRIDEIALKDAWLVDISQEIEVAMLLAKKAESNLSVNVNPENDSLYIRDNQDATERIAELVNQALKKINPADTLLLRIKSATVQYQQNFKIFLTLHQPAPASSDQNKLLNEMFINKKNQLLQAYSGLINRAMEEKEKSRVDSLINAANRLFREFSIDELLISTQSNKNPEIIKAKQTMFEKAELVQILANRLGEQGRNGLQKHRFEVDVFTARAKRNILTIIIITFTISIYFLFVFPSRIVKPISMITNIIRRAETGDYDIFIPFATQDEIGELAVFFNRMIKQVKEYDALKTEKIAQQQKKVEAIANSVNEGVLILNHENEVTVINRTLQEALGWGSELLDSPIQKVDRQGELSKVVQAMPGLQNNFLARDIKMRTSSNEITTWHIRVHVLRKDNGDVFSMILVFTPEIEKPVKPPPQKKNSNQPS